MQTLPLHVKNEMDRLLEISKSSLSMLVSRLDLLDAPTAAINQAAVALDQVLKLHKELGRHFE